ncbi:hypothetical protein FXN61_41560, partial [Lentzea sp. PSKA42]
PQQKCWVDDIGAYSVNEVAVNWNSALAWVTGKGGEEDKEHKSNYLVPTDEFFDDDRMVAPPVIGG